MEAFKKTQKIQEKRLKARRKKRSPVPPQAAVVEAVPPPAAPPLSDQEMHPALT